MCNMHKVPCHMHWDAFKWGIDRFSARTTNHVIQSMGEQIRSFLCAPLISR
jgi:hypothetical protein